MVNAIGQEMVAVMKAQMEVMKAQVVETSRLADNADRVAKALDRLYRNVELCTEPESFKDPELTGCVLKVRKYDL